MELYSIGSSVLPSTIPCFASIGGQVRRPKKPSHGEIINQRPDPNGYIIDRLHAGELALLMALDQRDEIADLLK